MINSFTIIKQTKLGRIGRIDCPHGSVLTPAFIFCATKGAIKAGPVDMMQRCKTQSILSNTYNLMDFPGGDFIENHGGIHKLMNWSGPMWTDSGGFQVFSLGYGSVADEIKGKRNSKANYVTIDENGIIFKSPRDGLYKPLTPELSIQIQHQIGADFAFVLDECTPSHMGKDEIRLRMERSHRWETRSYNEHKKIGSTQGLYGIVQGGVYPDLRQQSIDYVNSMDFFGYGIGGSLGKLSSDMYKVLEICSNGLNPKRPKHLLGIGKMSNIRNAVKYNIDTFDCVHPTRIARHGGALTYNGPVQEEYIDCNDEGSAKEYINITNAKYKNDKTPINSECGCSTCLNYSKAYIKYLFDAKEMLGMILLTEHNVYTMNKLMADIRNQIMRLPEIG